MLRHGVLLTTLVAAASASGGTRDDDAHDDRYVAEGARYRHCVGEISGESGRGERHKGSCVAFDPHHVLTAAHVIDGCKAMSVRMPDGSTHSVTMSTKCPRWERAGIGYGDLAVCRVRERFASKHLPRLRTAAPDKGESVIVVGYGFTGGFRDGDLTYDGRLRAGTNAVERVADGYVVCDVRPGRSELEYQIESGDSGGPLFDADGRVMGIHSSTLRDVGKGRDRRGDESVHARVDAFQDWITWAVNASGE